MDFDLARRLALAEQSLEQHVRERDWPAAGALLRQHEQAAPAVREALAPTVSRLLHLALRESDPDAVEQLAKLLLQIRPGAEGLSLNVARFLDLNGRRGTALDCYRRLIASGDPSAVPSAAMILAGIGRYDEALDHLERSAAHRASDQHLGLLCAARRFERAAELSVERFRASARTVADYKSAIDWLVRSGEPEQALALITAAPPDIRSDKAIAWYGQLYGFLLARIGTIQERTPPAGRVHDLLVSVIAWGTEYAQRLGEVTLASLAAPGNLPEFARNRAVTLRIYTDLVGRMILQRAAAIDVLQRHVAIEFEIIPSALLNMRGLNTQITARYLLLGAFAHLSVIEAGRTGRDAMLLGADCVYSNRFCTHLAELASAGREVISVSVGFSANDSALGTLERWRREAVIDIESEDLVDLGFAHMHQRTKSGCVDSRAQARTSMPAMLFFQDAGGLAYRKLGADLTYLANAAIRGAGKFDYQTPDGEMADRMVPPGEWHRIHRVSDSRDAILVELIADEQKFPEIAGERLDPLHVVTYADTYGFLNYMRHCFLYETRLRGRNPPPWAGDEDHSDFIERTRRLLFEV